MHRAVFIMFKKIENLAACEMRPVIRFLKAKNIKQAEIHHQLCDVYGEHAMSSSMVQRWVRLYNEVQIMLMYQASHSGRRHMRTLCGRKRKLLRDMLTESLISIWREIRWCTV